MRIRRLSAAVLSVLAVCACNLVAATSVQQQELPSSPQETLSYYILCPASADCVSAQNSGVAMRTSRQEITPTVAPTWTPVPAPSATHTLTPVPTVTVVPTPTLTPTMTQVPYTLGWGTSEEGVFFIAPSICDRSRDVALWVRFNPQSVEANLVIQMQNVTGSRTHAWTTWDDVVHDYVKEYSSTFDEGTSRLIVTIPPGVREVLVAFTNTENCNPMGIIGPWKKASQVA